MQYEDHLVTQLTNKRFTLLISCCPGKGENRLRTELLSVITSNLSHRLHQTDQHRPLLQE